jgi:NAD(P)-dependent dehydrogenase (short-subunit alcohol dehydrogenase family)
MEDHKRMTALVTGASTGIGKAIAERLAKDGLRVLGTARAPTGDHGAVRMLALDVCSDESVRACIDRVRKEAGHIDVLVNNAGFLLGGAVEEVSLGAARAQFETNFFGSVRVIHAVIPAMRERGSGRIVNVTSLAGIVPLPFWGFYNASKAALESLTETLRFELMPFGIHVSAVEPGAIKTPLYTVETRAAPLAAYAPWRARFERRMKEFEVAAPGPEVVADAVSALVRAQRPPLRTTVTREAALFTMLKRWTPASMFESQLRKGFKLDADRS